MPIRCSKKSLCKEAGARGEQAEQCRSWIIAVSQLDQCYATPHHLCSIEFIWSAQPLPSTYPPRLLFRFIWFFQFFRFFRFFRFEELISLDCDSAAYCRGVAAQVITKCPEMGQHVRKIDGQWCLVLEVKIMLEKRDRLWPFNPWPNDHHLCYLEPTKAVMYDHVILSDNNTDDLLYLWLRLWICWADPGSFTVQHIGTVSTQTQILSILHLTSTLSITSNRQFLLLYLLSFSRWLSFLPFFSPIIFADQ